MSKRADAARAAWTPERRELQRQVARRLINEGRFGGAQAGSGPVGRPKKRAPAGAVLLQVLLEEIRPTAVAGAIEHLLIKHRTTIARVAAATHLDRTYLEGLCLTALHGALADKLVPDFVIVQDDGSLRRPPRSTHSSQALRHARASEDAARIIVLREFSHPEARRLTNAELIEALVLLHLIILNQEAKTAIAVALSGISANIRPAIEAALAQALREAASDGVEPPST